MVALQSKDPSLTSSENSDCADQELKTHIGTKSKQRTSTSKELEHLATLQ